MNIIESISIIRLGDDDKKWDSVDVFNSFKAKKEILIKEPSNIDAQQGYQWASDCLVELFKSSS